MGEATPVADLSRSRAIQERTRHEVARGGPAIWERIRLRVDARLLVIERHAHRLLDRDLTKAELDEASSASGALAAELGRLELPTIARLARHLTATFARRDLDATDAVHVAGTTEDIRTLLNSAIAQQAAVDASRGTIVAIGQATPEFDGVCWVLATRGHAIVHDPIALPTEIETPTGVLISIERRFDDAADTVLAAVRESWAVPVIALHHPRDAFTQSELASRCSTLLPHDVAADVVAAEFARAEATQQAKPSVVAHGRVPREVSNRLRAHGFKFRRASTADVIPARLLEEPSALIFGTTAEPDDVAETTRILQALPSLRETLILWLRDHDDETRELAHRRGILPVDAVTDGVAAGLAERLRDDVADRSEADETSRAILTWSAARVLIDRSLVAAHRNNASAALTFLTFAPEVSDERMARVRETLSREFRRGDIIGSRDERTLVVLLQGVSRRVATNRFTELLERLGLDQDKSGAGVALFPNDGRSAEELLQAAEGARVLAAEHQGPTVVSTVWRPIDEQASDVLIVDSDLILAKMLSSVLTDRGYVTEVLDNGSAALERLTKPGDRPLPRLLLVDLDTAGTDGLTLVRRLRRAGVLVHMNVLLMTARSSEADLRVALDLGVAELIRKPFSGTLLVHRVGRILEDR